MDDISKIVSYSARVIATVPTKPGCWDYLTIGIFKGDEQIGSYQRNYSNLYDTFCPFEVDGKWYALYSRDYTSTRVMTLPECEDIGGEDRDANGFCPVDYYVPLLCGIDYKESDPKPISANHQPGKWAKIEEEDGHVVYCWPEKGDPNYEEFKAAVVKSNEEFKEWMKRNPYIYRYAKFGFMAGCVWGDDFSWKIKFIDLSQVATGKITIDDRFGYIELPRGIKLKDAIDIDDIDNLSASLNEQHITIAIPQRFTLDGKRIG